MARRVGKGVAEDLFGVASDDPAATGAEGHRNRMRGRLLGFGPDALADHEMLEMLLFLALPRRDTKPIARELLTRFGGFGPVVAASVAALTIYDMTKALDKGIRIREVALVSKSGGKSGEWRRS